MTVGIVALPLAMAFAIASGLKPEAGLWTAIIAGLLISLLGGSSVQIGGPAGAFIVIVYGIVERYGLANLLIATACAGVLLFAMGLLQARARWCATCPVAIVIGFTNGIAVLIACRSCKDWLGLRHRQDAGRLLRAVERAGRAHATASTRYAFALGLACVLGLFIWPRLFAALGMQRRRLPSVQRAARCVAHAGSHRRAGHADPAVLVLRACRSRPSASRFGGIPQGLPAFALPDVHAGKPSSNW